MPLGRGLPGRHDPGSRQRFPLGSFPPARGPLDQHFPLSPTPALWPETALFSAPLFRLAERAEEPPPRSLPSTLGGRTGSSGEVFEGPGGHAGPEEAPGRPCDRPGRCRSLRSRGASSPAPAFPGRAGREEGRLPAWAPAAPAARPLPSRCRPGLGLSAPGRAPRPLPRAATAVARVTGGRSGGGEAAVAGAGGAAQRAGRGGPGAESLPRRHGNGAAISNPGRCQWRGARVRGYCRTAAICCGRGPNNALLL